MDSAYNSSAISGQNIIISTIYICGSKLRLIDLMLLDCGNEDEMKPKDIIICRECNGRIFYKKRSKKASQYEAR